MIQSSRKISYLTPPERRTPNPIEWDQMDLFRGTDMEALEPYLRDCWVDHLPGGHCLIEAGKANQQLYVVLEGELAIHVGSRKEPPIATVGPGETVGEVSLIDGHAGSAYVIANRDCRLLVVDEELLWILVSSFHSIATNLLVVLARRLRTGNAVLSKNQERSREYEFQATIDQLTSLFNRYWLDKMLPRQMERAKRSGRPLSLVVLNIDDLDALRQAHGYQTLDQIIRSVGRATRENVRALDHVARFDTGTFALVCSNTTLQEAMGLANRLRSHVAAMVVSTDKVSLNVTLSGGGIQLSSAHTLETFLDKAMSAAARAQQDGGNQIAT